MHLSLIISKAVHFQAFPSQAAWSASLPAEYKRPLPRRRKGLEENRSPQQRPLHPFTYWLARGGKEFLTDADNGEKGKLMVMLMPRRNGWEISC
ncbi:hypothetical protein AVEN_175339-1 [Araneus ventricosus]|uniref:Uncharacterized protein n=1 Tax=Araneus ventricosus TaxID=182803 RepID=A0A4Y2GY83_ARAVE|nr:hypothetical protein AVEN_175339-1 [Araneus ventricosus]